MKALRTILTILKHPSLRGWVRALHLPSLTGGARGWVSHLPSLTGGARGWVFHLPSLGEGQGVGFLPSLFIAIGVAIASCASDVEEVKTGEMTENVVQEEMLVETDMVLGAAAIPFVEEEPEEQGGMSKRGGLTRSWTPPTPYVLYENLFDGVGDYINYVSLDGKTIDVFFTSGTEEPVHGRLRRKSDGSWKLGLSVDPEGVAEKSYNVYGFIPREAADNATIALLDPPLANYSNGAVLTIHGMKTVSYDACVIIGAKQGFSEDYDGGYTDANSNGTYDPETETRTNRLAAGDFSFSLNKTGVDPANYLYLLFDHLCSALNISMMVDGQYNDLRTIKLKELRLKTATDLGVTKKKMDVRITLNTTNDGSNPIRDVTYTPTGTEESDGLVFYNEDGLTLTNSYSKFMGHFLPHGVSTLILTSTYDVYDKNASPGHPEGNLIRKNCSATNTIVLNNLIGRLDEAQRGKRYTLDLTIEPTYLYVLSEPDLDNPTVVVN